jgi:bifunctional UDP-N-acetylglucosamine pyrophosphorylase/glucosamine-1-phosphate N-acetyltransferase
MSPLARKIVLVVQSKHVQLFEKELETFNVSFVFQDTQLGTGHAFQIAMTHVNDILHRDENVVCMYGDTPCVPAQVIQDMCLSPHRTQIVVGSVDNPTGYGRIIQDNDRIFIIEDRDCTGDEKNVKLVNMGIYSFAHDDLTKTPLILSMENAQHEMYLTEYISRLQDNACRVFLFIVPSKDVWKLSGVNSIDDLQNLETRYRQHLLKTNDTPVNDTKETVCTNGTLL